MKGFKVYKDTNIFDFLKEFHLGKEKITKLVNGKYYINGLESKEKFFKKNDIVSFDFSNITPNNITPFQGNLDILYEDDYLLIVNKPIKILTHPDGNRVDTLANIIKYYYEITHQDASVLIVQRLDFETSGVIVFPKDFLTQSYLAYQIENNLFEKEYLAIVSGYVKNNKGVINLPIGRNRHDSRKYLVSKTGKSAITHYEVLKRKNNKTFLKINIKTGRTHQIRVHLSHIGHPIIGDELYGEKQERLYLHAYKIRFIHPNTKKYIEVVTGDLPWNL